MPNYKVVDSDKLDADLARIAEVIRKKSGTTVKLDFPDMYIRILENLLTRIPYSEGLRYALNSAGTEYSVTGNGTCTDTDIIIPPMYEGLPVTSIDHSAFLGCSNLTSVTIPNSVTSIGWQAFRNCNSLISIVLPDKIREIPSHAFENCSNLISVIIPDSVTTIGKHAFNNCAALAGVIIPDNVVSIESAAFGNCSGLTSITIPDSVTSIGELAMFGCKGLISITFGNSVTSIGKASICGCTSLKSIIVSEQNPVYHSAGNCLIETASKTLVAGCKDSIIPADGSVTCIGEIAFKWCTKLTRITIPDSVTRINNEAFYNCHRLKSITIGSGVAEISDDAFFECFNLVEVYNCSSLNITKGFEDNGYVGCYALDIYTDTNEPSNVFTDDDGFIFYVNGDVCYLIGYTEVDAEVTLPEYYNGKIYSIRHHAFYKYKIPTSITIPDSVTSIGSSAFEYCSNLTSITLPFVGAEKNGSVNTHFGHIFGASNPDKNSDYIPSNLKTIVITGGKSIDHNAFYGCSGIKSITIPDSVTRIGGYAFGYCSGLTSITIPDSVTSIEWNAFQSCTGLTSITIGNSVESIGSNAFNQCRSLTRVTIPSSVKNIGGGGFANCPNREKIIMLPEEPPTLGSNAFFNNGSAIIIVLAGCAEGEGGYKSATNWSAYASKIEEVTA